MADVEGRREHLLRLLTDNPLLTDEELARRLGVSVPTIRLDRLRLGVPAQPERARQLAGIALGEVRALAAADVIGDLVEIRRGQMARSVLRTSPEMAFLHRQILRGHHLFAQANSLAVAVVDADEALTATARLRFLRPVRVGAVVEAVARVRQVQGERWWVDVLSAVGSQPVLQGNFVLVGRVRQKEESHHDESGNQNRT